MLMITLIAAQFANRAAKIDNLEANAYAREAVEGTTGATPGRDVLSTPLCARIYLHSFHIIFTLKDKLKSSGENSTTIFVAINYLHLKNVLKNALD